jgi:hypothetical protein
MRVFPITLEQMEEAYEATGLKPMWGDWLCGTDCGCPLTALYVREKGMDSLVEKIDDFDERLEQDDVEDEYEVDRLVANVVGLAVCQVVGFRSGYDSGYDPIRIREREWHPDPHLYDEAFEIGRVARKQFMPGEPQEH